MEYELVEEEKVITIDQLEKTKQESDGTDTYEVISTDFSEDESFDKDSFSIDKVRERTFNKELSDLVRRVRKPEKAYEKKTVPTEAGFIEEIVEVSPEEAELLNRFHELFYKAINLKNIDKINTDFNHFEISIKSLQDDLEKFIFEKMGDLSFNDYAVLGFNF